MGLFNCRPASCRAGSRSDPLLRPDNTYWSLVAFLINRRSQYNSISLCPMMRPTGPPQTFVPTLLKSLLFLTRGCVKVVISTLRTWDFIFHYLSVSSSVRQNCWASKYGHVLVRRTKPLYLEVGCKQKTLCGVDRVTR